VKSVADGEPHYSTSYPSTIRVCAAVHVMSSKTECAGAPCLEDVRGFVGSRNSCQKTFAWNVFSPFTTLDAMRETEVLAKGRVVIHVFLRRHSWD
jgi:hypothetical protein